jgi:dienelactone hydrolase
MRKFLQKQTILLLLSLFVVSSLMGKTVYLSSTGDDSKSGLTKESAVLYFSTAQSKAVAGDTIQVSGMIDFSTDPANTASPQIGIVLLKSLTVKGSSNLTDGFDGNNQTRFIQASNLNYTLNISNLKLFRGAYTHTTVASGGGALLISGSTVNGENLIFDSNSTSGHSANVGGAIMVGNTAGLNFKNCLFSNNSSIKAGALYINNATVNASLKFEGCAFISNTAQATIGGAALFFNSTQAGITLSFINCTVAKNRVAAVVDGGAIYLYKGVASTTVNIVNCTITENTIAAGATFGAGVRMFNTATGQYLGKLNIYNSIIEGNYSTATGTSYSDFSITPVVPTASTLEIRNSIVGRSTGLTVPVECYTSENQFNYLNANSTASYLIAKLAPFDAALNIYPLLTGSPAIDNGNALYLQSLNLSTDQVGTIRPFSGNKCYGGAVELLTQIKVTPIVTVTPVRTYVYNGSALGPMEAINNGAGKNYTFSYAGTGGTTYAPSSIAPSTAGNYTVTATVLPDGNFNAASSDAVPFTIFAKDPLKLYLDSIPTVSEVISTTNSGSGDAAITTQRFTFKSKNSVNTVYGIMAYPQAVGVYPGIMMYHGGGGTAESLLGQVQSYAALGYVTLAIDEPGIASITGSSSYSTGPWKSVVIGEGPKLNVVGGIQNSTVYDAVVASLQAFNFLSAQTNVDANKMGITGTSWGGYLTTMTSGLLGSRVKAAYSSFGCGFYDTGSFWSELIAAMPADYRSDWLTYLDAGRRANAITAPYFIEEPTNDTYFWPEAVSSTLRAIPGTKNHVCLANLNHVLMPTSAAMKKLYMNYYLKGVGSPFGTISITGSEAKSDGSVELTMTASLPDGVALSSVKVYYSEPNASWPLRTWVEMIPTLVSGTTYKATLSSVLVNQKVNYYAQLTDSRQVETSSEIMKASVSLQTADLQTEVTEMSVYPNPSKGVFRLKMKESGKFTISVCNVSGTLLWSKVSDNADEMIDLKEYSDGVYLLRVVGENKRYFNKLVKN